MNSLIERQELDWQKWMCATGTSTPKQALEAVTRATGGCDLHIHYCYGSLLDGMNRPEDVALKVKQAGGSHLFVTDHGKMASVAHVAQAAMKHGLKYIIGCEFYVLSTVTTPPEDPKRADRGCHLILLAKDEQGYIDLCQMCEIAERDGQKYGRPRIREEEVLKRAEQGHLICCTACLGGALSQKILEGDMQSAYAFAQTYQQAFRDDFYIELQNHFTPADQRVLPALMEIAQRLQIKVVGTNDSHYTNKEDACAHDILLAINTGSLKDDPKRWRFEGQEYWLKTPQEMMETFGFCPEALLNVQEILDKCHFEMDFSGTPHLPEFEVPAGFEGTSIEYFDHVVDMGMIERYGSPVPAACLERKEMEVSIIKQMGFVGYFQIVADFINEAKRRGIAVGPGRGSGAGSIVAYAMKITDIDPLQYGLIFERFLNPERISMPDFDIDFDGDRRQEVVDYVTQKYGAERVSQIITFQNMKARAVFKDVARVYGLPFARANELSALIPQDRTLKEGLADCPELKIHYEQDAQIREIIDMALRLEGLPKAYSKHAAGVLIADRAISSRAPLQYVDGQPVVQFTMDILEKVGLIKMDFLGLRTLGVIQGAEKRIAAKTQKPFSISDVREGQYGDVFRMLACGDTLGIFQFESAGMVSTLRQLFGDIDRLNLARTMEERKALDSEFFERLVAATALYRPGPMDYIPEYIAGITNPAGIHYDCPQIRDVLAPTYGVIVYQEQVQQICRTMAGYSLGRADLIRRAMGKKKAAVMEAEKKVFLYGNKEVFEQNNEAYVPGCLANGISMQAALAVWNKMEKFAQYAFNRSHAVAYTRVSIETAWLKYHFRLETMSEYLTSYMSDFKKLSAYCNRISKLMQIPILRPDVNHSEAVFAPSPSGKEILFGLAAVKGVGQSLASEIEKERQSHGDYRSYVDFVQRLLPLGLKKIALRSLTGAGALDGLEPDYTRAELFCSLDSVLDEVRADQSRKNKKLTDSADCPALLEKRPEEGREQDEEEMLLEERRLTSLYFSGSPFLRYSSSLQELKSLASPVFYSLSSLSEAALGGLLPKGSLVAVAGVFCDSKIRITKKKTEMFTGTLQDDTLQMEVRAFSQVVDKSRSLLKNNEFVALRAVVEVSEDGQVSLTARKITGLLRDGKPLAVYPRMAKEIGSMREAASSSQRKGNRSVYGGVSAAAGQKRSIAKGLHICAANAGELDQALEYLNAKASVLNGRCPIWLWDMENQKVMRCLLWRISLDDDHMLRQLEDFFTRDRLYIQR